MAETMMPGTMKAATWPPTGGAMQIIDAPVPKPKSGEVLVQVKVAAINEMDVQTRDGGWKREVKTFRKAGPVVTGFEFAGIAASSDGHIKAGMRVVAYSPVLKGPRAHAQFAVAPTQSLAEIPHDMSFADATALSVMGLTAIEVVDDIAKITPGQKVCVLGAAGGLGAYTVQLAKARGAHVTAIASAENEAFVMAQGADVFRARSDTPVLHRGDRFNLILDVPAKYSFAGSRRHLAPGGVFVSSNPLNDLTGFPRALVSRRKAGWLLMLSTTPQKLKRLIETAASGDLTPVIDATYGLAQIDAAFDRFATPGKQGRVLIDMEAGS
ncbi:NAD(P)-dependent alcohol dehydrogenase [Pyruvatibacter sp. HU-CL02332]|uniref:NAD(P)-dependent alcohol dehydrogenase n=1 Tax=Pyruvatibacter sp. HU-CL02332 TaxID=3127650 RepID=UPI003106F94F